MVLRGNSQEYICLETLEAPNYGSFSENVDGALTILWCIDGPSQMYIDGHGLNLNSNDIVFLTEFHQVRLPEIAKIRFLRFNKPFYCVLDFDNEVSCKGILFYGASDLPIIHISPKEEEIFETLWKMLIIEMRSVQGMQIEMLQAMVKRYLILCTRLYKSQNKYPEEVMTSDIIREFNYLVELHFKTRHKVSDYADLLNKSPKTLSNIFSKAEFKTPLQYINERRLLEARRLLHLRDIQVQEVAYEIGFDDIQSFSRFFRNHTGISPSKYKQNIS